MKLHEGLLTALILVLLPILPPVPQAVLAAVQVQSWRTEFLGAGTVTLLPLTATGAGVTVLCVFVAILPELAL